MDFKNERLMMSEEEARNRAKELLNENQVDLITKYMFLEQQVKKQKEVINKAINFLKKWGEEPDADMYIQMKEYKEFNELLDILKGVSK